MDKQLTQLAHFMHLVLCDLPHSGEMLELLEDRVEGQCYYFLEDSMDQPWSYPDHQIWLEDAQSICSLLQASPSEVLRAFHTLLEAKRKVDGLRRLWPNVEEFARRVIFSRV